MTQQQNWKISSSQSLPHFYVQQLLTNDSFQLWVLRKKRKNIFKSLNHDQKRSLISLLNIDFSLILFYNHDLCLCIYSYDMTNKLWKLESCDKLSSRLNTPGTPIDLFPLEMLNPIDRQELENFNLSPIKCKEEALEIDIQRRKSKYVHTSRLEEPQKKEEKKAKGLTSKTKVKLYEQIKSNEQELQQKSDQLKKLTQEYNSLNELVKQRRKQQQDISNNQKMLKSKEEQLSDFILLSKEIIETTLADIQKEKYLQIQNTKVLQQKKKEIGELKTKIAKKQQTVRYNEQLKDEKKRLEVRLQDLQKIQNQKLAMRSDAIREHLEKLISSHKIEIQQQSRSKCQQIRKTSKNCSKPSDLIPFLLGIEQNQTKETKEQIQTKETKEQIQTKETKEQIQTKKKKIKKEDFLNFSQLKVVPEFQFKKNKQSEKIFEIFDKQITLEESMQLNIVQDPQQLIQLKKQIIHIDNESRLADAEILQKEEEVKALNKNIKKLNEQKIKNISQ